MYWLQLFAALLPCAIASIRVAGPLTASPAANIFFTEV